MRHLIIATLFLFTISYGDGWNTAVTTTLTSDQVGSADNFVNKSGIHVLTIGTGNDNPSVNILYTLLNSSGSVVRSYSFETGGSYPCITGNENTIYIMYWKNQTIRTWKSTDAGTNWSDGAIDDISVSDAYCNGIDAITDSRGIHVVYATRSGSSGPWETYYQRNNILNAVWVDFKNVTDYNANEVGGFPAVTTSVNKVHVSYNTGSSSWPSSNYGDAKTRDYDYQSQSWEAPQLVYGSPSGFSMIERAYADGNYLHLFFYKIVSGMGNYHADLYHTKRTLYSSTWNTPVLLLTYADVNGKIETATTTNGILHVTYPSYGLAYRTYDGSNWSSEYTLSNGTIWAHSMSKAGNDLFCFWKEDRGPNYGGFFTQYRQYDAAPVTPTGVYHNTAVSPYINIRWAYNPEPDIQYYDVTREGGTFQVESGTSFIDPDFMYGGGGGTNKHYQVRAVDNGSHVSGNSGTVTVAHTNPYKHGVEVVAAVPEQYALKQNYPNPFNPATTLRYELPNDEHVTLKVYDMLGKEIATVVNGFKQAGYYEEQFDASSLTSGVYVYRFTAGQYTSVGKMLLMK